MMKKFIIGMCLTLCGVLLIGMGLLIGKTKGDNMALTSESTSLNEDVEQLTKEAQALDDEKTALQQQLDEAKTKNNSLEQEKKQNDAKEETDNIRLAEKLAKAYQKGTGYTPEYIEFDHKEGDIYIIHAYDTNTNGEETGGSSTLNWYEVDLQKLYVKPMNN